jgi:methylglyoxal synthase
MRRVCDAVAKPVIVAGSIDREDRVTAVAEAGAAGFTVGTAALDGAFPAESASFAAQVRSILAIAARARARSTAPRRLAIVAHDQRKPHLRAWVLRHLELLGGHRLVCTGGTGAMIAAAAPGLSVQRLQRGSRGGDQQLGALIATGELDGVIFFADPTVPHVGDVDLQALTRLAIVHDVPIALSVSAADMLAAALLGSGATPK